MRMRIQATLSYTLTEPTDRAYVQARIVPAATARQHVLAYPLEVEPAGWQFTHDDYWGTRTVDIEVSEPHTALSLGLICDVGLMAAGKPLAADCELLSPDSVYANFSEFLLPGSRFAQDDELAQIAQVRAAWTGRPTELVEKVIAEYAGGGAGGASAGGAAGARGDSARAARGTSGVVSPGLVGDDLTHAALRAVRAAGVPARFVSGYRAPAGDFEPGDTGDGALSSWIDFWDGAWHGWDPVSNALISDRLVIVGWGRTRADVQPLSGIHRSDGDGESRTEVTVTRLS